MPGGQPTKYREEYCQMLIDHMAEGMPYETFAAVVGCCRKTIYNWEKQNPAFLHAKKKGRELGYKFWMQKGMQHLVQNPKGPFLNNTVWVFAMKNMFNWKDNPDPDTSEDETYKRPDSMVDD